MASASSTHSPCKLGRVPTLVHQGFEELHSGTTPAIPPAISINSSIAPLARLHSHPPHLQTSTCPAAPPAPTHQAALQLCNLAVGSSQVSSLCRLRLGAVLCGATGEGASSGGVLNAGVSQTSYQQKGRCASRTALRVQVQPALQQPHCTVGASWPTCCQTNIQPHPQHPTPNASSQAHLLLLLQASLQRIHRRSQLGHRGCLGLLGVGQVCLNGLQLGGSEVLCFLSLSKVGLAELERAREEGKLLRH